MIILRKLLKLEIITAPILYKINNKYLNINNIQFHQTFYVYPYTNVHGSTRVVCAGMHRVAGEDNQVGTKRDVTRAAYG